MVYLPRAFRVDDLAQLHAHIAQCGLATLVTTGAAGPLASHVPMLLDAAAGGHGRLLGHLARANAQWQESDPSKPALAIFMGPDAYVSPSWYPSKAESGRVVPTWNYAVVHALGPVRFFDDAAELRALVDRLTDRHERGRSKPWQTTDAPERFIESQLKAIVGFEIVISGIEGKYKLSQNRAEPDQAERQSNGDEQQEPFHPALRARRSALPTTSSDELDIAAAATSGVASPAIATRVLASSVRSCRYVTISARLTVRFPLSSYYSVVRMRTLERAMQALEQQNP